MSFPSGVGQAAKAHRAKRLLGPVTVPNRIEMEDVGV